MKFLKKIVFVLSYILFGISSYFSVHSIVKRYLIGAVVSGSLAVIFLQMIKYFRENDEGVKDLDRKLNKDLFAIFKEKNPKVIQWLLFIMIALGVISWGFMFSFVLLGKN